jgi:adenine-specific DNA-methyltransferase
MHDGRERGRMTDEPDKVDLETPGLAAENRAELSALFPGLLDDGVLDAAKLGELLDIPVAQVPDGRERYGLQWAGRHDAVRSLLTPSRGALSPDAETSLGFDTARNVFIEGDNLEVLKLLQKAYNDRVKVIFIDPPYNTGNDFVYKDDFADGLSGYLRYTGQLDEEGNRVSTDVDAGGRRHSRWLSMMYPRLVLARNLLREDGAIFVAIDDNEGANLRLLMDEIFGAENFLANVVWKHTQQSKNDEPYFSRHWNSILAYRRSAELEGWALPRTDNHNKAYRNPDGDPKGPWRSGDVRSPSARPTLRYNIETPSGGIIEPPANGWRWSRESVEEKIATGEIIFSDDETRIIRKIYLADQGGRTPENVWDGQEIGVTRDANREIQEIFGSTVFDTPKPTGLIRRVLQLATKADSGDLVLDFFAGSGSTAHAVALQNADDGGRRRVISVNIPEETAEGSEARRAGYETVSAITLARLQWVNKNVEGAQAAGLKVFSLSQSNFRATVEGEEIDLADMTLAWEDTDWQAVAAEVLLKEGVPLDEKWRRHELAGTEVVVADGVAVVLSDKVDNALVDAILKLAPRVVVFMEDGFAGADAVKANAFTNAKNAGITMKTV